MALICNGTSHRKLKIKQGDFMEETKVEKTLKESDKVKTVDSVEYKCYLILGGSPTHKCRRIDITESIPDELIEEYYGYTPGEDKTLDGIAASVIGVEETISYDNKTGEHLELPVANPMGIFISVQQKVNTALQAAIVNERQLNALLGIIDGIFKQCSYERELGVKCAIEENQKH